MLNVVKSMMQPPRYYVGPVWLNRLGLQPLRVWLSDALHRSRKTKNDPAFAREIETIEEDGIVTITNLLSPEDFAHARELVSEIEANGGFKVDENHDGSGVRWIHGPITDQTEGGKWLIRKICEADVLKAVVEATSRRTLSRRPQLIYQRLEVPEGREHLDDVDSTLHADRHFTTVKAYFCLNDNDRNNGAYVWCPGSHKLTRERLEHEYEYSIRETQIRRTGIESINSQLVENHRNAVSTDMRMRMKLKEVDMITPANTLVISNNRGFHKRGKVQPGHVREQFRLVFHYLEEPIFARIVWWSILRFYKIGLLPKGIANKLRSRGLIEADA